jgi:predicted transcriptional regulator
MFRKSLLILLVVGALVLPGTSFSIDTEQLYFTTQYIAESLEELKEVTDVEVFQEKLEDLVSSILPSLSPPVISDVEVKNITENSATIFWKTNVKSSSIVAFAPDREYKPGEENPYLLEVGNAEERVREHKVELVGLSPGTLYHFQVKSSSLAGVTGKSEDQTFSTLASKIKLEITKITNTEIEARWITPVETDSYLEYQDLKTGKISKVGDPARVKSHIILLTNLTPDNLYEIRGFGYTINNILIESDPLKVKTKLDTIPPKTSGIRVDNALLPGRADRALTVVSWRTDEPANSIVNFEEGLGFGENLANQAGQKEEFVLEHTVILTTKTGTVYRIQVVSVDESKNETKSSVRTILTPRGEESILDVIIKNFQETFKFLKR